MKSVKALNLLLSLVLSFFLLAGTGFCEDDSLIVTPEGNVGIGISNPQNKLHVNGNVQAKEVVLENSSKTNGAAATNGTLTRNGKGNLVVGKNNVWTQVASPVGSIIIWPTSTPPEGYKECNGGWVSKADFPELYAAIGTTYGNSGGNFKLPDYRGEFLRGWDHGRGVDSGRGLGSSQSQSFQSHKHIEAHAGKNSAVSVGYGYSNVNTSNYRLDYKGNSSSFRNPYTSPVGGAETRPRNIAVMFCIKAR